MQRGIGKREDRERKLWAAGRGGGGVKSSRSLEIKVLNTFDNAHEMVMHAKAEMCKYLSDAQEMEEESV
jgi:hypothetical protein